MKKTFEFGSGRLRGKVGIIAERKDGKDLLKDLLGQFSKGDGRGNVVMVRINDDALAKENGTRQPARFTTTVVLNENRRKIMPPFLPGASARPASPSAWKMVFHFPRQLGRGIATQRTAARSPAPF